MAASVTNCCKHFIGRNYNLLKPFLLRTSVILDNARENHMFRHLAQAKEHDTEYLYEESRDPKEWEYVEKLMPLETVPEPIPKESYSSGWRPVKDEAYKLPYFVERSKNHLLSVYLENHSRGQSKATKIKRIQGNLWQLHNELKSHIEMQTRKKIISFVHEGNNIIQFKGDYVYYVEQWLLNKGF